VIKEFSDTIPKDSPHKLPPMCDTQHTIESDSEEFIYYVDEDVDDEFKDDHEGEDIAFSCIRLVPLTHLLIVNNVSSQSKEKDN